MAEVKDYSILPVLNIPKRRRWAPGPLTAPAVGVSCPVRKFRALPALPLWLGWADHGFAMGSGPHPNVLYGIPASPVGMSPAGEGLVLVGCLVAISLGVGIVRLVKSR